MRICGVELKANDANLCLLHQEGQLFDIPDCRSRRFSLPKVHSQSDLKYFHSSFEKLMQDYKVDKIVIRERMTKGKFAGGSVSFKLEAAIQLLDYPVAILPPAQIKTTLKDHPLVVSFEDTGLKAFQELAFLTAYAAHQSS